VHAQGQDHQVGVRDAAAKLLSKVRTIAAFTREKSRGEPIIYPDPGRGYVSNFLHMMFSRPYADHEPTVEEVKALQLSLILHADHEQNCSTSTARMVGSSGANLFASISAAVCGLWGPLHGGANANVIRMLGAIDAGGESMASTIDKVKKKQMLLWGLGHRVYKNFDPRVKLLRNACQDLLKARGVADPLLDIAEELEQIALKGEYFIDKEPLPERRFLLRHPAQDDRYPSRHVHRHVRDRPDARLDRQLGRELEGRGQDLPPQADLHG
jgi:citrate synthase